MSGICSISGIGGIGGISGIGGKSLIDKRDERNIYVCYPLNESVFYTSS
jgi:hypothetical protein